MPEIHSDRSRSRRRRPNKDNDCDESFDSTDELEDDPVVLERREKQARKMGFSAFSLSVRADRKSQVRQCLGVCKADFWSSLVYESAEQ